SPTSYGAVDVLVGRECAAAAQGARRLHSTSTTHGRAVVARSRRANERVESVSQPDRTRVARAVGARAQGDRDRAQCVRRIVADPGGAARGGGDGSQWR